MSRTENNFGQKLKFMSCLKPFSYILATLCLNKYIRL